MPEKLCKYHMRKLCKRFHQCSASFATFTPRIENHNVLALPTESFQARWQCPQCGLLKCNIDVSFSTKLNKTCIGMCIREEDGAFY